MTMTYTHFSDLAKEVRPPASAWCAGSAPMRLAATDVTATRKSSNR